MKLDNVSFKHDDWVLRGISLDVPAGARLAILGANGSGKSTLLKLMAGAWRPAEGTISLEKPYDYSRRGRRHIREQVQLVLQEPDDQLFAPTVLQDISYGPVNLGASDVEKRVADAMGLAGVTHLADRVPHRLSYGQRKLVALAGALAMRPRFLLLDEPTAGLDPIAVRSLLSVLAGLDCAVVLTTHDVDFAWEFASDIAVLREGTLEVGKSQLLQPSELGMPWAPVVSSVLEKPVHTPEDLLD
ncbi:energy-coupling factor ABC transporter ATP-binding protein [Corynebacterium sp. H130]|uniref:energy-coupling factor ABC transporter ATP-binding protein n=1 Tax=Corynebacterium sp. H130 TaxID=3133444 RepID=UPI0030977C74